jgi:hypothetical protein
VQPAVALDEYASTAAARLGAAVVLHLGVHGSVLDAEGGDDAEDVLWRCYGVVGACVGGFVCTGNIT